MAIFYTIFRAAFGLSRGKDYTKSDKNAMNFLMLTLYFQLLLGIALMFLSPVAIAAFSNLKETMANGYQRLMFIEHPAMMIISFGIIQIGKLSAKRAYIDHDKHKRIFIYVGFALVLILLRIPWENAPLFRFLD